MMGAVRRLGTYSIVARDPDTLDLGVAVQSHWFSVGSVVPWLAPAVGAVATQSVPLPNGGPRLLEPPGEMSARDPPRVIVPRDEERRRRQGRGVDAPGAGGGPPG